MHWQRLWSPRGRVSRAGLWRVRLSCLALGALAWLALPDRLALLTLAALFWIDLVAAIKRLHDRGRDGWFLLLSVVPFLGLWLVVELLLLPGDAVRNA